MSIRLVCEVFLFGFSAFRSLIFTAWSRIVILRFCVTFLSDFAVPSVAALPFDLTVLDRRQQLHVTAEHVLSVGLSGP